jgi:hypothetical protein
MANVDRSRSEVFRRRVFATYSTDVINKGDMVISDGSGHVRPASAAATADAVADKFEGIAIHAKPSTDTPDIVVGVDVIAEMDVSALASAAHVGDKVEPEILSGASLRQKVTVASTNPIGAVAKEAAVGDTTLTCHFVGRSVASPVVAD